MNQIHPSSQRLAREAAEARFAARLTAVLDEGVERLDTDVTTRLRFARTRALERAQWVRAEASAARLGTTTQGAVVLGGEGGWWIRLASIVPLLALVCGLLLIQHAQNATQIAAAAEVDAALLADDLPPKAYVDPAFGEFLKLPPR